MMNLDKIQREIQYSASRSSGSGGQHVNKVATKVELRWDIIQSKAISPEDKIWLLEKCQDRIVQGGIFQLFNEESRSQVRNKRLVWTQFCTIIQRACIRPKPRKQKPKSPLAKAKRLQAKKHQSEKKKLRQKVSWKSADLSFCP